MLKARQILAISVIILIFSGWGSLVWATGLPCSKDAECPSSASEQCCCCKSDQTCPTNPAGGKGVCFPKEIVTGKDNKGQDIKVNIDCKDIICPFSSHTSVKDFIDKAVNYIFYVSVILAPLMIVIGAFLFLTSAGSPKQSKLGSSIIQWAIIGFAIILFAKGISAIIKMILVG